MSPLAVPEYCGAMSIGTDQIGPMTSSRKKNPPDRHSARLTTSRVNSTGIKHAAPPSMPTMITTSRENVTRPVLCSRKSLMIPPRASPTTPARNTPPANTPDFLISRLPFSWKNCGIQLRNSHKDQP